jgi:5-methylcytosine-specific restriction protein A
MKFLLDAVQSALDALRAASGDRDAVGLAPAELVAVNKALGVLRRSVDAATLPVATEIARQSRPELGRDSLAKQQGFSTAGRMISTTTGTSVGEALRLVAVGEATAPRMLLSGEAAPAKYPHVAKAVGDGAIGTLAASAIIGMLDRVALRADRDAVEAMEVQLVQSAPGLSAEQLRVLIARGEALLDPDGVQPREEELRAQRGLTIRQEASGAIALIGRFDPATSAPIVAAVEGMVTGMLRRRDDGTSVAETDERTITQMRADALSELCRHGVGCQGVPTAPSTTIVVRMNLTDLQDGVGVGAIDGIAQPVSAATVRQMAVDARIIPCVLSGDSEILDWGRGKRIFTPAQKLALAERDGGCAFCGLPPGMTAAHHLRWWARDTGPTEISNGILLCTNCHHRIHDDGWEIRIDNPSPETLTRRRKRDGTGLYTKARTWFIPPAWIDSSRTPRLGGRARYDLTA